MEDVHPLWIWLLGLLPIFALIILYELAYTVWPWVRLQIDDWLDTRRVLRRSKLLGPNPRQQPPAFFQGLMRWLNPSDQ